MYDKKTNNMTFALVRDESYFAVVHGGTFFEDLMTIVKTSQILVLLGFATTFLKRSDI